MSRSAVACIAIALLAQSAAFADPTTDRCVAAYKTSQQLRRDGALRAAREQLLVCGRDPCPAVLQTDCVTWLGEVEPLIPSIVVKARMGTTTDVADVRVLMDGVEIAAGLDGHAIAVDPGQHVFAFERTGAGRVEKSILIVEGERGRVIEVELTAGAPSSERSPTRAFGETRPIPRTAVVLGAVGIAGLGIGGVLGTLGLVKRDDLASCRPYCSDAAINSAHTRFVAADIAFVAGGAALITAAIVYVTRPSVEINAVPTNGGAMVSVGSAF